VNAAGPWGGVVAEMLGAPVRSCSPAAWSSDVELPSERAFTPFVMDYVPGSRSEASLPVGEEGPAHAGLHTEEVTQDAVSPNIQLGAMTSRPSSAS